MSSLGHPVEATQESAAQRIPKRNLVVAAHGQLGSVSIKSERRDRPGMAVTLRGSCRLGLGQEGRKGDARTWAVKPRTAGDPSTNHRNVIGRQRLGFLRHAVLGILLNNQLVEVAGFRLARHHGWFVARAGPQKSPKGVEAKMALRLIRPVTGNTMPLEQRCNVGGETHISLDRGRQQWSNSQRP
jgi:hypothetical protein